MQTTLNSNKKSILIRSVTQIDHYTDQNIATTMTSTVIYAALAETAVAKATEAMEAECHFDTRTGANGSGGGGAAKR